MLDVSRLPDPTIQGTDCDACLPGAAQLDEFEKIQTRLGLSTATVEVRRCVVSGLLRDVGLPPEQITAEQIQSWLDTRSLSAKSRGTYMSHISSFYEAVVGHDPLAGIKRPRVPRYSPRPISEEDLQRVMAHASGPVRLILMLAAYQGLRGIEISRLRWGDITADFVYVSEGKGGHARKVPTHPEVLQSVNGHDPEAELFPGKDSCWVRRAGNHFLQVNGVDATLHQLRHRFATQMLKALGRDRETAGQALRLVQEMLGHSDPGTTAVYTAVDVHDARSAMDALTVA